MVSPRNRIADSVACELNPAFLYLARRWWFLLVALANVGGEIIAFGGPFCADIEFFMLCCMAGC